MKDYFKKKIVDLNNKIESTKNTILREIGDGKFSYLKEAYDNIMKYQELKRQFTIDAIEMLQVHEIIEIHQNKSWGGEVQPSPFNTYDISYGYQYAKSPISIQDRDLLVTTFGYQLKSAKV